MTEIKKLQNAFQETQIRDVVAKVQHVGQLMNLFEETQARISELPFVLEYPAALESLQ